MASVRPKAMDLAETRMAVLLLFFYLPLSHVIDPRQEQFAVWGCGRREPADARGHAAAILSGAVFWANLWRSRGRI